MSLRRVCVFCGSKEGNSPVFREAAAAFGRALARKKLDLVYGGAGNGLMGAVASAVLEGGGHVIGVVPRGLARQEFAHPGLSEHHLVDDLGRRKQLMAEKADAFVALPGGFGTMDELFEMLTEAQLGIHSKPIGLLDTAGYYGHLTQWIAGAVQHGFIPAAFKDVLAVSADPDQLVDMLLAHQPPAATVAWIKR